MAKITIEFNTDNAAFDDNLDELDYVFKQAIKAINDPDSSEVLCDSNGNKIGQVSIYEQS